MIIDQIKKEIEEFEKGSIEIVPGYNFNQKETLNRIFLYFNSKYESGEFDDQGDKKYFYNIVRAPCNTATKAIDFDTKDIRIFTAEGGDYWTTWLFARDLKFWMKDRKFGKVLNRIFFELPIFGSVVLKIIDGKIYFVDLRNFIIDQAADSLDKANYIIETHNYTPIEFTKIAKEKQWKNWEKVLDLFRNSKDSYIKVYERYGEDPEDDFAFKRIILAEVQKDIIVLDEEKIEEIPYWEFHWEKIPGRWLGIGRVEIVFDPQIRVNEITNQQVKSSYWSTLRIWQTTDEGIDRNLLTDVENGEILHVESEIRPVDMVDRNLSYYSSEIQKWLTNRDEITFSYDVIRGERLPAGTPLGSAQLATAMISSYFDQIRENIAMDIKELFYEVIIPSFMKENSREHLLRIAGEDLEELNNLMIKIKRNEKIINYIQRNKTYPSSQEIKIIESIIKEELKNKKEEFIYIPKDFYKDVKYKIDIDIVGEAIDTRIRATNMWLALQAITSDPTLLIDPIKKKFFYKYLEMGGISPVDLNLETTPSLQEEISKIAPTNIIQRGGGGVSKPTIPAFPIAGPTEQTI